MAAKSIIILTPMLRSLLQWYALRFRFPHRGLKYLLAMLKQQRLLQHNFLKRLPNGLLLQCQLGEHIERQVFWYDGYELPELGWLQAHLAGQSQPVLYDVGANIGFHSLYLAQNLPALKAWCFEPSPANLQRLHSNLQLNPSLTDRLQIVPVALGARRQELPLFEAGPDNRGMHSLVAADAQSTAVPVEVWPLDQWMADQPKTLPAPTCIKMDIEGAEWLALQGMEKLLRMHRPTLGIELDDRHLQRFGTEASQLVEWLQSFGYQPFQLDAHGLLRPLQLTGSPVSLAIFLPQ